MTVRVLCTGDLHIGRRASKVAVAYRTALAWRAIVHGAISQGVDVVAISGDIIDRASRSYESITPLTEGLADLRARNVDVVAVAGNHDFDVFPGIVSQPGMEHVRLVGKHGQWERMTLERDGQPFLHVDGWSFSREHVSDEPMLSYRAQPRDHIPVLGLLHCDLDNPSSSYAPARTSQFHGLDVDLWLLGHIHVPGWYPLSPNQGLLYPGSPYAMDPGETGLHGYWIADLVPNATVKPALNPVSPTRYEQWDLDVSAVSNEQEFQSLLSQFLRQITLRMKADAGGDNLKHLNIRLRYTGQSHIVQQLHTFATDAQEQMFLDPIQGIEVSSDTHIMSVRPAIALDDYIKGNDPVAETARLIKALESDGQLPDMYTSLVDETRDRLDQLAQERVFVGLESAVTTDPDIRTMLKEQAWTLLNALLETRPSS